MHFWVLANREGFAAVVAIDVGLTGGTFESVSFFFAFLTKLDFGGWIKKFLVGWGADVWVYEFAWFFAFWLAFRRTIHYFLFLRNCGTFVQETSLKHKGFLISHFIEICEVSHLCFQLRFHFWTWFFLRLNFYLISLYDRPNISRTEAKYVGELIFIISSLFLVMPEVVIDNWGKSWISGCRGQFFPADDALTFLFVDEDGEAGSAESVIAGLDNDRVDHNFKAIRAYYLLLDRWNELFRLFLLF